MSERVAVIGIPGAWSSEALAEALHRRTGFHLVVDMAKVVLDLEQGTVRHGDQDLLALDGFVVKKLGIDYSPGLLDRLEMLSHLAAMGIPVMSSPDRMFRLVDRLSCTLILRQGGIPMPPTVVTEDADEAEEAVRRFGTAVLKPLFSSKARGMCVVSGEEARSAVQGFREEGNAMVYVQKMLPSIERDLGLAFLGGRFLGAYARVKADGAWNTTIHSGGRYEAAEVSEEIRELAERAQALFELDFTTVDIVETPDGPLVFEVSAFGGFRGLKDALDLDAAALYADHALSKITEMRARR